MKTRDLTTGPIGSKIFHLSVPIIMTQFVQMSYNLMDVFWLGRLSTLAVSASGTVSLIGWLANSVALAPRVGTEIGVAKSVGRKDDQAKALFLGNGLKTAALIGLFYGLLVYFFHDGIIGFFKLGQEVHGLAIDYLLIYLLGMVPLFLNPVFSGIYNGSGNSRLPFIIQSIGLVANIILDPLLIFGLYGFPQMGIKGAALATTLAQYLVLGLFFLCSSSFFEALKKPLHGPTVQEIYQLGIPAASQSSLFAAISMVMTRFISSYGPEAIAANKVGNQIESLTWMSMGGISMAISSFVAQNDGARKKERIIQGVKIGLKIALVLGSLTSLLFLFFSQELFAIFIPEDAATALVGSNYLKILAISEIFMATEIVTTGAFNGLGLTKTPAYVGVFFNFLRIPFTFLAIQLGLGINTVWWIITLSAMSKGLFLFLMMLRYYRGGFVFRYSDA